RGLFIFCSACPLLSSSPYFSVDYLFYRGLCYRRSGMHKNSLLVQQIPLAVKKRELLLVD
ncbi:MAG: hypothetical protein ACRCXF_05205, partial [Plesiomonas shigelloides]